MGLLNPEALNLLSQPQADNQSNGLGLLSPEVRQLIGNGGLLGRFQPSPNESWSDKLFGTDDPRDPRGRAMMAFATTLGQYGRNGGFSKALAAYNQAYDEHQDRVIRQQANNLTMGRNALELQSLLSRSRRDQNIQTGLKKLQDDEQSQQTREALMPMLDRQPVDEFGTASIGGTPLYSMRGPEIFGSQPAATIQAPQPQGVMRGAMPPQTAALTVGNQQFPTNPVGSARGNYGQGLSNRFMKQAEVYAGNGDFDKANKLYEQAAKWMPEVHKIEVAMHQGQPVNVITMKDGQQVLSPFGPAPKVHWADTGSDIRAIDEYTMGERGRLQKSMTPGERASTQVAWANYGNARDRLNFDRSQANKPQFHEGAWHVPPSATNPQGSVIQPQLPAGTMPKLTEVQANATQFATRMRDASKIIDGFEQEGGPWASTVARAGYDPQFPSWMLGGQVVSGVARGLNNFTVPADAQRYYQAQTNWVTANLRKESGAAIGKDEMTQEIRKWFPQPGDGADVIAQKAAARKVAEEGMLVQAGPGARQVSEILQRTGKTSEGNQKAEVLELPRGMNVKELKHGALYRLPGGKVGMFDSISRRFTEQ